MYWHKSRGLVFQVLVIAGAISSAVYGQDEYQIDNAHTSLIFSISHMDIGYIYGRFNKVSGVAAINRDAPDQSRFTFTITAESIDTNDDARDKHLRSADFFDVENHPKIEFVSERVSEVDGVYNATGKMKILGVEKEVTIPLQLLGVGKGPFNDIRIGMLGKFMIKRSDFGMDKMLDGIGDKVAITLSFEGVKK